VSHRPKCNGDLAALVFRIDAAWTVPGVIRELLREEAHHESSTLSARSETRW
jgi:hypothetical protein